MLAQVRPLGIARREAPEHPEPGPDSPVLLERPRRFDRRHVIVVALLGLLALFGTWWWLGRSTEAMVPLATPTTATPPQQAPLSVSPATPRPGVFVHVIGAVQRPGVIELPAGARVAAAIQAAGGLNPDADPAQLNLAAPVTDGAQIVIGTKAQPRGEVRVAAGGGSTAPEQTSTAKVNLNTASQAELEKLPGVGPATAQAILSYREAKGRFTRIEELQEVDGIGAKTFAKLAPLINV